MCLAIHKYHNFTTELTNCLFVKMDVAHAASQVSTVRLQNEICTICYRASYYMNQNVYSQSNYDLATCLLQY